MKEKRKENKAKVKTCKKKIVRKYDVKSAVQKPEQEIGLMSNSFLQLKLLFQMRSGNATY